ALYLPTRDDPAACTLVYLAVQASQRRHGIARAMLQQMTARHPHAELACAAGKVPVFEAMGFQVLAARGPQVLMNTRTHSSDGLVAVQDLAPIFQSKEVRQIHAYLLKQHGNRAMSDAEKQRDYLLDQMARQAEALVDERLRARRLH
ncbi:MAG: GNAT family N-acetyltransferase, partial [Pseudomonas sp.]